MHATVVQWFSCLINSLLGVKYQPLDATMKGRSNPHILTLMPCNMHSDIVLPHTHTSPKFLLHSGSQSLLLLAFFLFLVL